MKTLKPRYLNTLSKLIKNPVHPLEIKTFDFTKKHAVPGEAPGIEDRKDIKKSPDPKEVSIDCINYSESDLIEKSYDHIDDFLAAQTSDLDGYQWININGVNHKASGVENEFERRYPMTKLNVLWTW